MNNNIETEVKEIVAHLAKVRVEQLEASTDLNADLNLDSLLALQIVAAVEKRFDVEVPDDEIDLYTSVDAIANVVRRLQTQQSV